MQAGLAGSTNAIDEREDVSGTQHVGNDKDQQEQSDEELAGWQEMFGSGFAKKDEEVKTEKDKTTAS